MKASGLESPNQVRKNTAVKYIGQVLKVKNIGLVLKVKNIGQVLKVKYIGLVLKRRLPRRHKS
jgi:hypothetical protein